MEKPSQVFNNGKTGTHLQEAELHPQMRRIRHHHQSSHQHCSREEEARTHSPSRRTGTVAPRIPPARPASHSCHHLSDSPQFCKDPHHQTTTPHRPSWPDLLKNLSLNSFPLSPVVSHTPTNTTQLLTRAAVPGTPHTCHSITQTLVKRSSPNPNSLDTLSLQISRHGGWF